MSFHSLLLAVNICCVVLRYAVDKKGAVPSHQQYTEPLKQVGLTFLLLLASAAASLRISATASSCHPPRDSTAKGINFIPWRQQSSRAPLPLFFLVTATSRAWPGLAAAPATVAAWRGCITVTSQAVSSAAPKHQPFCGFHPAAGTAPPLKDPEMRLPQCSA